MIFKLLAKAINDKKAVSAGYCPEADKRVKRMIEAKMSVRNIQATIEEEKRLGNLKNLPIESVVINTSEDCDEVSVPGIEVEELTEEEAEALLEMTDTVHVEDMTEEPPVFVVSEVEDADEGVHFGQGLPGIEVVEFGFTPDGEIKFDGNSDEVLTAWGAFSTRTEPVIVEEENTGNDWDDVRLGREDALFKRGSS